MKKKKNILKLNKKVVSQLTETKIKGGNGNPPSAGGSCFVNCGGSTPCYPTQSEPIFCYASNPAYC